MPKRAPNPKTEVLKVRIKPDEERIIHLTKAEWELTKRAAELAKISVAGWMQSCIAGQSSQYIRHLRMIEKNLSSRLASEQR